MHQSAQPINHESNLIEERYNKELWNRGYESGSSIVFEVYAKEIQVVLPKKSSKLEKFRKAGLIGCLNDSGITSKNYKNELYRND